MAILYNPQQYFFGIGAETIAIIIAFSAYFIIVLKELKNKSNNRLSFTNRQLIAFIITVISSSLLGGRLWHYIFEWDGIATFIQFFNFTLPGLASWGMIFGGTAGVIIFNHFVKDKNHRLVNLAIIADILAKPLGLWVFLYRIIG